MCGYQTEMLLSILLSRKLGFPPPEEAISITAWRHGHSDSMLHLQLQPGLLVEILGKWAISLHITRIPWSLQHCHDGDPTIMQILCSRKGTLPFSFHVFARVRFLCTAAAVTFCKQYEIIHCIYVLFYIELLSWSIQLTLWKSPNNLST